MTNLTVSNEKVANAIDLREGGNLQKIQWKSGKLDGFEWNSGKIDSFELKSNKLYSFEKVKKMVERAGWLQMKK